MVQKIESAEPPDSEGWHLHLGPWVSEWFAAQHLQRQRRHICLDCHLCEDKTRWIHQLVNERIRGGNLTRLACVRSMEVMNTETYWQAKMTRLSASLCSSKTSDSKAVAIHCKKRGAEEEWITCCLQLLPRRFLSTRSDSCYEHIGMMVSFDKWNGRLEKSQKQ